MKIVVSPDYVEFSGWFHDIVENFYEAEGEILWNGRNVIKRFEIDGHSFVFKKYQRVGFIKGVFYTLFKKTKARRAFEYASEYRRRGINTLREVAYIELKERGIFSVGYFISKNCDKPGILELLPRDSDENEFDYEAAKAVARYVYMLHRKGVMHEDLNLSDILYEKNSDGEFEFTLIDINKTKFYNPNRRECAENISKLTHNREHLEEIVREYCLLRKWDFEPFYSEVYAFVREKE